MLAGHHDVSVEAGQHVVQFYEHDENLALAVSSFLGAGLVAGEVALVVATPAHRDAFEAVLAAAGVDVRALRAAGLYRSLDAGELLATFLVDGHPDRERFDASVGEVVSEISATGAPVRIYGEMVALLWEQGQVAGAMAVEQLWNDLGRRTPFTLFCAYPTRSADGPAVDQEAICAHHSGVVAEPGPQPVCPDEVSQRFEPTPFATPVARRFVTEALLGWGHHDLVDATELVVTEMVTNAVRHSRQRFGVAVSLQADAVRAAVTDPSPRLPTMRAEHPDVATGGRGMHLIAALSRRWGIRLHDGGKTVWAEVDGCSNGLSEPD